MKLTELKKQIDQLLDLHPFEDYEVVILTDDPSMGPRSSVSVEHVHAGFDWEKGRFLLKAKVRLTKKTEAQDCFDAGRDLLMYLATKPGKRESYETRTAKNVMKRCAGYTDEHFEKYRRLFHKEPTP